MAPAFLPGDRLLVDLSAFRRRAPSVGEVVVLRDPEEPGRLLLKRIAAVGPRSTAPGGPGSADPPVPPGQVRVLSDDRRNGRDSRRFGPVPATALVGRAWYRYAPATRRGPLPP